MNKFTNHARRAIAIAIAIAIAVTAPAVGALQPAAAADPSLQSRRADFDVLLTLLDDDYAYADAGIACRGDLRARFAARVAAAETPDAWRRVVEDVIDALHDFHAEVSPGSTSARWHVPTSADVWAEWRGERAVIVAVRDGGDAARAGVHVGDVLTRIDGLPSGAAIDANLACDAARRDPTARRWALLAALAGRIDAARRWTLLDASGASRVVELPRQRRFERPAEPVSVQRRAGDTPVIRINNSLGRQETVAAFDAALASVRDAPGLILDLRDVPSGGNSSVALGILGRFVTQRLPYQRHRIPNYGQPDVARDWVEEVAPRGPFRYDGRLVVLVDAWTGSMGEGMAIGLDGMHRATVVGTPMAGLAGAVEQRSLRATGLSVRFPVEQVFHVDGTPRHAWRPPVEVAPRDGIDVVLERGLEVLRSAPR